MNEYRCTSEQLDPHIQLCQQIPEFISTCHGVASIGTDGIRTHEPSSDANYLNSSNYDPLSQDEQFYHNPADENVVLVQNVSPDSAASSSNLVGQLIHSIHYVNTQKESSTNLPLQQVSQPCQQDDFLQHLKRKEQIDMVQQLNASGMRQELQKPLPKNFLEKQHMLHREVEKQQLALTNNTSSTSHQVGLQSSYHSTPPQRMIGPYQHQLNIAQQREVISPLCTSDPIRVCQTMSLNNSNNALYEVPLDSKFHDQNASDDWFNKAYMRIQMLREIYVSEVETIFRVAYSTPPPHVGSTERFQRNRSNAKGLIKFLYASKADLVRYSKDTAQNHLNTIECQLKLMRAKTLCTLLHHEQPYPPVSHPTTSQLQQNRNRDMIFNQHEVSRSQENVMNSLLNDSACNALCSLQNSSARSLQQYPPSLALQTNMMVSHNKDSQFGIEQRSPTRLHHGLGNSLHHDMWSSEQNITPSTMGTLPPSSSINSTHVVNQKPQNHMLDKEKIKKSQIEKKNQQMLVQKEFNLQQLKSNIQPAGHSPHSLRSSLQAHHEKRITRSSPLSGSENTVHLQRLCIPVEQPHTTNSSHTADDISVAILASPLSTESGNSETGPQSHATRTPLKRLIEVVESVSVKTLRASLHDFNAIISLLETVPTTSTEPIDHILEPSYSSSGRSSHNKVVRNIRAMAFDSLSFNRGENFETWCSQASDMVSTTAYGIKKRKIEHNIDVLAEIRAINLQLVESWLDIDLNSSAIAEAGDGKIIRCSYNALGTLAEKVRMQYASSDPLPDFTAHLLVPADYPNPSPILLDTSCGRWSEFSKDMSMKLDWKLNQSLRMISVPLSLGEMATTWDACARAVFFEFAEERIGKSLISYLGTWENCIPAS